MCVRGGGGHEVNARAFSSHPVCVRCRVTQQLQPQGRAQRSGTAMLYRHAAALEASGFLGGGAGGEKRWFEEDPVEYLCMSFPSVVRIEVQTLF